MNPPLPQRPYPKQAGNAEPGRKPLDTTPAPAAEHTLDIDIRLITRMRMGDEAALGAFYDRWFSIVHAIVARMVRAPDEVEDVVEEIFWQVWRQADRFSPDRGSVQTWLLTVARSRALDRLRALRRLREDSIDAGDETPAARDAVANATTAESNPALDAEQNDQRRIVLAALAELPAEQRETMELAYYGGLSQSEIAERTSQPLGTVKTRMRLAMQKLRDRLSSLREDTR
jgi:RNA polymerase sigma-70 factor (ECF subfamily)